MIVVKTSHFGSNRSYGLAKAILLYSDGQEAFATVHEPKNSPDGGAPYLDAGEPLTVDFLRQLAKGLGQTVAREVLPANVLARRVLNLAHPGAVPLGYITQYDDGGTQSYNGLLLTTDCLHLNSIGAGMIADLIEGWLPQTTYSRGET